MSYELIHYATEDEYRAKYVEIYCDFKRPIFTFDRIQVKFYPERFDHAFFESNNWVTADKSIFSNVRAERILWIKEALEDPTSILYEGWDKVEKAYNKQSRVAVVCGDYVVVIGILKPKVAKFITAYKAENSIGKITSSPLWIP